MILFKNISKRGPLLVLADLAAVISVIYLGSFFRTGDWNLSLLEFPAYLAAAGLLPVLFYVFDLYYPYKFFKPGRTFFEIALSVFMGTLILAALSYADHSFILPRSIFFLTLLPVVPLVFIVRMIYDGLFRSRFLDKRTLIVGTGSLARDLILTLDNTPHSGLRLVGAVSSETKGPVEKEALGRVQVLGNSSKLATIMAQQGVHLVVLALETDQKNMESRILTELFRRKVAITSAVHLLERLTGVIPKPMMEDSHYILGLMAQVKMRPYLKLKRILDVISASTLLFLLSPILFAAIIVLALSGPHQIFFIQERVGLNGASFQLIKLRSMMTLRDGQMAVTRLGKWLRKYRLDEIPQFVNVLKGDMSLVGPRPEIPFFVKRSLAKIPMYEAVFSVKPGLTGWAQVKFRYTTSVKDYHEKFRYNLFYLKNMSFTLDMLIIFRTVRVVILGSGQGGCHFN